MIKPSKGGGIWDRGARVCATPLPAASLDLCGLRRPQTESRAWSSADPRLGLGDCSRCEIWSGLEHSSREGKRKEGGRVLSGDESDNEDKLFFNKVVK